MIKIWKVSLYYKAFYITLMLINKESIDIRKYVDYIGYVDYESML